MSRNHYDIDPAGDVLCTYTEEGEREKLRSVSVDMFSHRHRILWDPLR